MGHRRVSPPAPESSSALLAHLERVSGTTIRTREDIDALLQGLDRQEKRKRAAAPLKHLFLVVLLFIAVLQYYFIDVQVQILSQQSLTVFVPVRDLARARPQRISGSLADLEATRKPPAPALRARSIAL